MRIKKYKKNDIASVRLDDLTATFFNAIIEKYNQNEYHINKTNANLVLQNAICVLYSLQIYCSANNIGLNLFYTNYKLIDIMQEIARNNKQP